MRPANVTRMGKGTGGKVMKMEWIYQWQLGERVRGLSHQGHTLLANHRAADDRADTKYMNALRVWYWLFLRTSRSILNRDLDNILI